MLDYTNDFRTEALMSVMENNFKSSCRQILKSKGVTELSLQLLRKCLKIPEEGIKVETEDGNRLVYLPVIDSSRIDDQNIARIGTYSVFDGKCIFVYYDGTYLTKSEEVIYFLGKNGFKRTTYTVPLSKNEKIFDPKIEKKWSELKR